MLLHNIPVRYDRGPSPINLSGILVLNCPVECIVVPIISHKSRNSPLARVSTRPKEHFQIFYGYGTHGVQENYQNLYGWGTQGRENPNHKIFEKFSWVP